MDPRRRKPNSAPATQEEIKYRVMEFNNQGLTKDLDDDLYDEFLGYKSNENYPQTFPLLG